MRYAIHAKGGVEGADYTIIDVGRGLIILGGYIPRKAPIYSRCDVEIPVSTKKELKEVIWSILRTQGYAMVDSYTENYIASEELGVSQGVHNNARPIFDEIMKSYL